MQQRTPSRSDDGCFVVVVLGLDPQQAQAEGSRWREKGAIVLQTKDAAGCLRVATSVRPDVIVLDRAAPQRLLGLLRAHPSSASALIEWLPAAAFEVECRAA
jgi:hypothetical protein